MLISNSCRSLAFNFLPSCRLLSNYKSSISLDKLYPKSSLSLTVPVQIPDNQSQFSGYIPVEKLQISYSRSSGPGGQHVNMVNTKVDIRFHVESADWLNDETKKSILEKLKTKINKDGFLVVRSDRTRSQIYNQADAITTLRELIRKSTTKISTEPSEETIHMLRKRKEQANRERILAKKSHSLKKQNRQSSASDF